MSLRDDIKKLKEILRPKRTIKFVLSQSEITDDPNIIWVLFKL